MKKFILPILVALTTLMSSCEKKSNSVELQIVNSSEYYVVVSIDAQEKASLYWNTSESITINNPSNLEYYIYIELYSGILSLEPVKAFYIYKQLLPGYKYKLFITNEGGKIEGALNN